MTPDPARRLRAVPDPEPDLLDDLDPLDDLIPAAGHRPTPPGPAPAVSGGGGLDAGDLQPGESEAAPAAGIPVDPPAGRPDARQRIRTGLDAERRPIIPTWLSTAQDRRAALRFARAHGGHAAAFHGLRLPWYAVKVAVFAPVGVVRLAGGVHRFVTDAEAHHLRAQAVTRDDPKAYLSLVRERNARVVRRAWAVGLALALLAGLGVVGWLAAPAWVCWAVLAALVAVAARHGRPPDRPILGHAVSANVAPRLTSQAIVTALGGLGIAALTQTVAKGRTAHLFPAPIARTRTGWCAQVDLPHGVTAEEIADRRSKLASGLRRPIGSVWPEGDPEVHEGRLVLYVLDQPFSKLPQPAWPLARSGAADLFAPLPYGFDQRGDLVAVPLMFTNLLVGAIPRQGKSFAVRVFVLAAALDPTCELHIHELKGTDDFAAVKDCCHRFTTGPARDQDLAAVMASIREVHSYLEPRALTIARLGVEQVPDKKVTRALAGDRDLGLWPVLLVVDEVQELFESEYAAEAEQLLKAIIKRGPALGVMLILATQRPDAKSLPTAISANMGIRLCLRVMSQLENDMVLGTSAYKSGMRATALTDADLGVGLLRTGGTTATTVRSAFLDAADAERIGRRALGLRRAAGTLTGAAIGQVPPDPVDRLAVVLDAIEAWPAADGDDDSAWLHTLESAMSQTHPDRYADLEAPWLGARLRALGVPTLAQRKRNTGGEQTNRAGVALAALRAALEAAPDLPT